MEKIRQTKNEEIKQKLLDALKEEEEARMLHEQELENQGQSRKKSPSSATSPRRASTRKLRHPRPKEPRLQLHQKKQEMADIQDLTSRKKRRSKSFTKSTSPTCTKGCHTILTKRRKAGKENVCPAWKYDRTSKRTVSKSNSTSADAAPRAVRAGR